MFLLVVCVAIATTYATDTQITFYYNAKVVQGTQDVIALGGPLMNADDYRLPGLLDASNNFTEPTPACVRTVRQYVLRNMTGTIPTVSVTGSDTTDFVSTTTDLPTTMTTTNVETTTTAGRTSSSITVSSTSSSSSSSVTPRSSLASSVSTRTSTGSSVTSHSSSSPSVSTATVSTKVTTRTSTSSTLNTGTTTMTPMYCIFSPCTLGTYESTCIANAGQLGYYETTNPACYFDFLDLMSCDTIFASFLTCAQAVFLPQSDIVFVPFTTANTVSSHNTLSTATSVPTSTSTGPTTTSFSSTTRTSTSHLTTTRNPGFCIPFECTVDAFETICIGLGGQVGYYSNSGTPACFIPGYNPSSDADVASCNTLWTTMLPMCSNIVVSGYGGTIAPLTTGVTTLPTTPAPLDLCVLPQCIIGEFEVACVEQAGQTGYYQGTPSCFIPGFEQSGDEAARCFNIQIEHIPRCQGSAAIIDSAITIPPLTIATTPLISTSISLRPAYCFAHGCTSGEYESDCAANGGLTGVYTGDSSLACHFDWFPVTSDGFTVCLGFIGSKLPGCTSHGFGPQDGITFTPIVHRRGLDSMFQAGTVEIQAALGDTIPLDDYNTVYDIDGSGIINDADTVLMHHVAQYEANPVTWAAFSKEDCDIGLTVVLGETEESHQTNLSSSEVYFLISPALTPDALHSGTRLATPGVTRTLVKANRNPVVLRTTIPLMYVYQIKFHPSTTTTYKIWQIQKRTFIPTGVDAYVFLAGPRLSYHQHFDAITSYNIGTQVLGVDTGYDTEWTNTNPWLTLTVADLSLSNTCQRNGLAIGEWAIITAIVIASLLLLGLVVSMFIIHKARQKRYAAYLT